MIYLVDKVDHIYRATSPNGQEHFESEFWHVFQQRLKRELDGEKVDMGQNKSGEASDEKTSQGDPEFPPIG